jgi:hypothetical protein
LELNQLYFLSSTAFVPFVNLTSTPQPAGFIDFAWSQPRAKIYAFSFQSSISRVVEADVAAGFYTLNMTSDGTDPATNAQSNVTRARVSEPRFSLALPSWGKRYKVSLGCSLRGVLVRCWTGELTATLSSDEQKSSSMINLNTL